MMEDCLNTVQIQKGTILSIQIEIISSIMVFLSTICTGFSADTAICMRQL